ncbi:NIF family HAD-type phosphatase [uncultured Methylophaga sp.]|uniref:NIF family HAD-type phosphatase n=1 Tax=uncultured Methylophaga sp. TaxID=285271 RepID=UPI0026076C84|nr:NIF family HAD-type phosphatase [uncultured Methylophaga sp.]
MSNLILALDLEGVLITNAISQFPRPGLRQFLTQCEEVFGHENICIFTKVPERRFRVIASTLVKENNAPRWFENIRYIDWVGEHKDLRFVHDDIEKVIIVDDYPPYIKQTQKHRLIQTQEYKQPYTHAMPDITDKELEFLAEKLKELVLMQ